MGSNSQGGAGQQCDPQYNRLQGKHHSVSQNGCGICPVCGRSGQGCRHHSPFAAEEGIESFAYVVEGEVQLAAGDQKETFSAGGYAYAPAGTGISFRTISDTAKILLYKQKYIPYGEKKPYVILADSNQIEYRIYDDMENVFIKDFLPTDDLAFDMNMHILSFEPGGCHPFVETHVQEHGMYILTGEGMYLLDDTWMGIKKDDFVWFGAYCPQCAYGVGREPFAYIYSKDCNRDVTI